MPHDSTPTDVWVSDDGCWLYRVRSTDDDVIAERVRLTWRRMNQRHVRDMNRTDQQQMLEAMTERLEAL